MFGHIRRNWLSWMALLLLGAVFFNVKQIRNLFELPRLDLTDSWSIAGSFYAFIGLLLLLYFCVGCWVVPFDLKRLAVVSPGLDTHIRSLTSARQRLIALIVTFMGVALVVASFVVDGPYLSDKSVLRSFGFLILATASLLFLWAKFALSTQRLLTRTLVALIGLNVLGEVLWYFANTHSWFSPRNYSLWAILHVFFCVFLFARVVDVWQSYSDLPLRAMAIVSVVMAIGWSAPTSFGEIRAYSAFKTTSSAQLPGRSPAESDATDVWLQWIQKRLEQIPNDGPVILIAASGGGSRASLFTSLVYEELARQSVTLPSGQKYRPAEYVLMISSVSGGTLASSCLLDTSYSNQRSNEGQRRKLRNSIRDEIIQLMPSELSKLKNLPWSRRMHSETNEVIVDFVEQARDDLKNNDLPWFGTSPFVDDMCTDFMAPLLRGAIHPGRDRAQSVAQFWQARFGLRETNLQWRVRWENGQVTDVPPVLLCNVSEVDRGSRLIIGFPPLPVGFFDRSDDRSARSWVDLDSQKRNVVELSIADATLLSANFPWGFPIGSVPITERDQFDDTAQREVHLIDGGVCDNSGIDSLRYVVDALRMWEGIETPEDDWTVRRKHAAAAILNDLRHRGIVLLEIDSGAKPERPGWVSRVLTGILEPVTALENASYATAAAAVKTHINVLNDALPSTKAELLSREIERLRIQHSDDQTIAVLSADEIVNVKRLTITCNHQQNVMTAWALGPTDKAQVFVRFLVGSRRLQYELQEYMDEYHTVRSALTKLEQITADLSAKTNVDTETINKVIDIRNELFATSRAAENLNTLRIGSEKLFYQGVSLPTGVLHRIDDEVRTGANWQSTLPEDVVPDITVPESRFNTRVPQEPDDAPLATQYDMLQNAVQKVDSNVKLKRTEALDRIEKFQPR